MTLYRAWRPSIRKNHRRSRIMTIFCGCFGKLRRRKAQSPSQEKLVHTFASRDSLVVELASNELLSSTNPGAHLFSPSPHAAGYPSDRPLASIQPNQPYLPCVPPPPRQRGYCQSESSSEQSSSSVDWSQSSSGSSGSSSGFHFRPEQIDFHEFGKKYLTKPNTRNPTVGNVQLTKNDRMPPEMRRNIEKHERNLKLQHQFTN